MTTASTMTDDVMLDPAGSQNEIGAGAGGKNDDVILPVLGNASFNALIGGGGGYNTSYNGTGNDTWWTSTVFPPGGRC